MFWNKKKKLEKELIEPVINREEIMAEIEKLKSKLENAREQERIDILNELGSLCFEIEKIDEAISYYETSLNENNSLGKAYTDLMKLYNIKRRQATESKDEDVTRKYMDKIDDLMKLSKDVIRGRV